MTTATASRSFLDTGWARFLALVVAFAGIVLFWYTNPGLFVPGNLSPDKGKSPYEQCLAERSEAVDKMAADAGFTDKQKELALIRARETCHNLTGG